MRLRYILILILSSFIFSQSDYSGGYVKGQILSEDTGLPVQYAIVSLISKEKDEVSNGTMSNEIGGFKVENVSPGQYDLLIESTGYEKMLLTDQLIVPPNMQKDIGLLMLVPKTLIMEDVEIAEEKDFVEEKIDKKVYNADVLTNTKGGDATDILGQIPSVTVDMDNNIELRGDSNVTILIDGRKSTFGSNVDMIAAEMVEKVEVITTPSAKYDPEGTAGIINIILRRNEYEGTNGKLGMNIGELFPEYNKWHDYGVSGTFSILKQDWNVFSSFGFKAKHNYPYSLRTTIYYDDPHKCLKNDTEAECSENAYCTWEETICIEFDPSSLADNILGESYELESSGDSYPKNTNFKLGIEHYPSASSTIAFDITRISYNGKSNELQERTYFDCVQHENETECSAEPFCKWEGATCINEVEQSFIINKTDEGNSLNYGFGYFNDINKNQKISIEFDYDNHNDKESIESLESSVQIWEDEGSDKVLSIDYTHPMDNSFGEDKISQIEIGFEYFSSKDLNHYNYIYNTGLSGTTMITTESLSDYKKRRNSAYLNFGYYMSESFGIQFGTRLEKSKQYFMVDGGNYDYKYSRVYPTLHFLYDMEKKGNIKFGFARRINRPWHGALNPFEDASEYPFINVGNPNLIPEDIYKWELSYSAMTPIGYLSTSFFSSTITNQIDRHMYTEERDGDIVQILTWINQSRVESNGAEIQIMTQPKKFWNLMLWATYWSNDIINPGINGITGKESGIYAHIMSKFTIDKTQKIDVTIGGSSPMKITSGVIKPMFNLDVSYKKEINKKFSFIATIKDLFDSRQFEIERDEIYTQGEELYLTHTDAIHRRNQRKFKISFEYTFGAYQKKKYIRESHEHRGDSESGGMNMGY